MYHADIPQGVWVCQVCRRPTIRPFEIADVPTCGQRDRLFCQNCAINSDFHFQEVLQSQEHADWVISRQSQVAMPTTRQSNLAMPTATVVMQHEPMTGSRCVAEVVTFVETVCPQPTAVLAKPCQDNTQLPLTSNNDEIARFLQANFQTESQLTKLKQYLTQNVIKEIDRLLAERALCVVCFERPKEVIALPCKHRCMCQHCFMDVKSRTTAPTAAPSERLLLCPLCRAKIEDCIVPFE